MAHVLPKLEQRAQSIELRKTMPADKHQTLCPQPILRPTEKAEMR
jgi:hypothetical protein